MLPGKNRKWILLGSGVVAVALVVGAVVLSRHWPFSRTAVTRLLESRFGRGVEIGSFRETWFPPGCVARNVRFEHRLRKDLPPLITANDVVIAGSWTGLMRGHIATVKIAGLHITVPPPDASGQSPLMPQIDGKSKLPTVDRVEADNADLIFLPHIQGGATTSLRIYHLEMTDVSPDEALAFRVSMRYDKPAGDLTAWGRFGPWNKGNPDATPISGGYRFADADLKAFYGLTGSLTADGTMKGDLAKVSTQASVDVPDLHVDKAPHSVHLQARFQASVDTSTLDTQLESLEAHAGKTVVLASGTVSGPRDQPVKIARLDMRVDTGRVEDLLNYFSEEGYPSMTGAVKGRGHAEVELPPHSGFLKKVRMTGDFTIAGARLTNQKTQESVDHLSESAKGESKKEQDDDPESVPASVSGHVAALGGVATLSNVSVEFPGATADMAGTFNLLSKNVDFHGTLRTTGKLPDATTGIKAVLLKIADPLMKKHKMTVAPFTVSGNASNPTLGLDLRRLK